MKIIVNSESRELPEQASLTQLLAEIRVEKRKGLALAVNETVIPTQRWESTVLAEGDRILLIQASQGG